MPEIIHYIRATYTKYTFDFTEGLKDLELDDPIEPMPLNPADQVAFKIWKLDIKDYQTRMQEYSNFRSGLYNLVLGQCTQSMQEPTKIPSRFSRCQPGWDHPSCHTQVPYTLL